jgi:hypothetical protein
MRGSNGTERLVLREDSQRKRSANWMSFSIHACPEFYTSL